MPADAMKVLKSINHGRSRTEDSGPQALGVELVLLTDFRQALEANICLTLEGRHMTPGLSLSIKISSSISWGPKVQFLLVGKDINLALSVTGAKRKKN